LYYVTVGSITLLGIERTDSLVLSIYRYAKLTDKSFFPTPGEPESQSRFIPEFLPYRQALDRPPHLQTPEWRSPMTFAVMFLL
jgi:hypothetical protein